MSYNFEGFKGSTRAMYVGGAVKYHIQVGMVDTIGKTLGIWDLDARVELILYTGEGQQETESDQLREQ